TGPQTWVSSNGFLNSIPSPEDGTLYARDKLDYVVTYYDKAVFNSTSVTVDDSGDLRYTVLPGATITSKTYFNIIFVVKP
ncbi:MAG: hypothetical protein LBJ58_08075, partial [Tannerellaceae bacterium]|nr:hypothetical protein [Tannerellaceae bacterium]